MQNPYKTGRVTEPLTHLQADVSTNDWDRIYLCSPYRGMMDATIAIIIKKLSEEVHNQIPTDLTQNERERRLITLIRGCSFPSVDGTGHFDDERNSIASILPNPAKTPSGPGDKKGGKKPAK